MLFQQNHTASQENKGFEAADELVISRGHTAKMFQFVEKTFDQMSFLVLPPIAFPRVWVVIFRRYGICGSMRGDIIPDFQRTESLVPLNHATTNFNLFHQRNCHFAVMDIAAGKQQLDRIPKSIDQSVYLGIVSAA